MRISFGYMSTFEDAQAFLKFILAIRQSGCNTVKFLSPGETVSELVASIRENDHLWDNNSTNKLSPKNSQFRANSPVIMSANLQSVRKHSARDMVYVSGNSTEALPSGSRPITVTNIYLYPIKSCAAFEVSGFSDFF